jgi:hypothetical protein
MELVQLAVPANRARHGERVAHVVAGGIRAAAVLPLAEAGIVDAEMHMPVVAGPLVAPRAGADHQREAPAAVGIVLLDEIAGHVIRLLGVRIQAANVKSSAPNRSDGASGTPMNAALPSKSPVSRSTPRLTPWFSWPERSRQSPSSGQCPISVFIVPQAAIGPSFPPRPLHTCRRAYPRKPAPPTGRAD